MSQFWKKFLRENDRKFFRKTTKPTVYLGAFGKHPGWDDHIDDIGLETESLLLAKQILYVDGIGGQIDSAAWDKLAEAELFPEFKHIIIWKRGDAFLLGRIWSSRDGKNRTKYPMIVCSQCVSVPLHWALVSILPVLEKIEQLCKNTNSPDEVRDIIKRSLAEIRQSLESAPAPSETPRPVSFVDRLGLVDTQEKLFRIVYDVSTRQMGRFPGGRREATDPVPPRQIRLPAANGLAQETLAFWCQFLESQMGTDIPLLLALPLGERWLDATSGEPASQEFYSLRAKPEVMAIACEVPYEIDDEFRKTHQETIHALMAA